MASNFPNADLEDSSWQTDVQKNLSILTKSLSNLDSVLIKLLEHNLISDNECEIIGTQETAATKNLKLLFTLKAKGWSSIKSAFMKILKETRNDYCVQIIESSTAQQRHSSSQSQPKKEDNSSNETVNKLIKSKWWPETKFLPNWFYERKTEKELFTEKLKKLLTQNENKTTVINQKVAISGFGGVGKSTTAKWFGVQYGNDYDFIFWIDCGDRSLIKSFAKLARDLNVKDRTKLELTELATRCFEILEKRKCLLIYDNAECYVGVDGIRDALPKNNDNFHIIITSRNREWENDTVFGTIPECQLDVFEKSEALDFMSKNVSPLVSKEEPELETICELLGNLPLALQIALAVVNRKQISLSRYIETLKNTDEILLTTIDDYERTINKTMQISLDIIRNSEIDIGGLANEILLIFGFISPHDVELAFFKSVKKEKTETEIYEAFKLLASYSLVTHKTITNENNSITTQDKFSIHPLLQHVIRYNSAVSKTEILKTILNCEGFLENKVIPYSYADKELQDKYPHIKEEFIHFELMKRLKERKFHEALEISRLLNDILNNLTSRYNYAMCLKYNSDERKSIEIFESLFYELRENFSNASKDESYYKGYFNQFGIIQRNKELNLEVVGGQLFLFYANEGNEVKVRNYIFSEVGQIILPMTALNDVIYSLNRLTLTKYSLSSDHGKNYVSLSIDVEKITTIFELSSCEVDENTKLPTGLQELNLRDVKVVDWKKINWSLNKLNLSEVHILELTQMTVSELKIEKASLDIFVLPHSIQKLELYDCNVIHPSKNETSSDPHPQLPDLQQLKLYDVKMRDNDGNELINFDICHLLLQSLHKLEINCETSRPLLVSMESIKSISSLHMWNCHLRFCKEIILYPKELTLFNVQIIDEQNKFIENNLINNFVDFRQMEKLKLCKMSVDLNQPLAIKEVTLRFVQVDDWINAKWTVNKLSIVPDQKKTGIRIVKNFENEKFKGTARLKQETKSQDGCTNNLQAQLMNESEKVVKHTHDTDFQVSLLQMLEITKVLEDYTELEKDWTRILIGLRLSGKSIGELENLKCNFGKLILETLRSWHREKTTNATFDAFVKVIEKHTRHALAAAELRKNKEIIRMAEFD